MKLIKPNCWETKHVTGLWHFDKCWVIICFCNSRSLPNYWYWTCSCPTVVIHQNEAPQFSSHIVFCRIHYKSRMRSLLPQLIVSLLARQEGRCRWSWDFTAELRTQSRIGGLNYFSWYYTRCLHGLYLSIWIIDLTLTLFFVTPL